MATSRASGSVSFAGRVGAAGHAAAGGSSRIVCSFFAAKNTQYQIETLFYLEFAVVCIDDDCLFGGFGSGCALLAKRIGRKLHARALA